MDKYKRPASLDRFNDQKSAERKLLEQLHQEMLYLCQEYDKRYKNGK